VSIVVFDIDGVLADATHRQHHVASRPKDWDAFFAAVGEDPVIEEGRELLLAAAAEHEVVLVSGRPERTRADTVAWLERSGMGAPRLVLRADDDWRPAAVAKLTLIRSVGQPEDVGLVVDDDPSVVEALSGQGYPARLFP
jgi:phosphoglycolate phosphatase-like HAD superfamily hydrolase